MRWGVLAVVACILVAGCAAPFAAPSDGEAGASDAGTPDGDDGATDADDGADAEDRTASNTEQDDGTPDTGETRPDPDSDRLGWEDGYWHDDPVPIDASDGLNGSERAAVVARAMARVEVIRNREFEQSVNVTVVNRTQLGEEFGSGQPSEELRAFDNAKFAALFLIGTDEDSIEVQSANRNRSVAGFYSPGRDAIVLVSDSPTPQLDSERTLAHELVHALQDQQFDLSLSETPRTRDAYNARNGLIEGDARAVEREYMSRCGETWSCLSGGSDGGGSAGGSIHYGVYVLSFFPYSDGPSLVASLRDGENWSGVDAAFADPPRSSAEVIFPERYGSFDRTDVEIRDRTADGWERVRPEERPDYDVLGPSALAAMFAYTIYDDYDRSSVVGTGAFVNTDDGSVDSDDPFEYGLAPVRGWRGDRLHVYERGDETGYVWRLVWESPAEAEQFADAYRTLVTHWGGEAVGKDVYVVGPDSPFTGAVALEVEGDTVTVVGGPDREALGDVRRGAG